MLGWSFGLLLLVVICSTNRIVGVPIGSKELVDWHIVLQDLTVVAKDQDEDDRLADLSDDLGPTKALVVRVNLSGNFTFDDDDSVKWSLRLIPDFSLRQPADGIGSIVDETIFMSPTDAAFIFPPVSSGGGFYKLQLIAHHLGASYIHPVHHRVRLMGHCHGAAHETKQVFMLLFPNVTTCILSGTMSVNGGGGAKTLFENVNCNNTSSIISSINTALRDFKTGLYVHPDFTYNGRYTMDNHSFLTLPLFVESLDQPTSTKVSLAFTWKNSTNGVSMEFPGLKEIKRVGYQHWAYRCDQCTESMAARNQVFCTMVQPESTLERARDILLPEAYDQFLRHARLYPALFCIDTNTATEIPFPTLQEMRILGTGVFSKTKLDEFLQLNHSRHGEQQIGRLLVLSSNIRKVSTNGKRVCVIFWGKGRPLCWSTNIQSDLASSQIPEVDYSLYSLGETHSCGITGNYTLFCFGSNTYLKAYPPGIGDVYPSSLCYRPEDLEILAFNGHDGLLIPQKFISSSNLICYNPELPYSKVAVSGEYSCALGADNKALSCFGRNTFERLGPCPSLPDNGLSPDPLCVQFAGPALDIKVASLHSCALWLNGSITCWGYDKFKQVSGAPSINDRFMFLAAGDHHNCAVRGADRTVVCWGEDHYGETAAPMADGFFQLELGRYFSCGLRDTNYKNMSNRESPQLICWGKIDLPEVAKVSEFGERVAIQGEPYYTSTDYAFQPYLVTNIAGASIVFDTMCRIHTPGDVPFLDNLETSLGIILSNATSPGACLSAFNVSDDFVGDFQCESLQYGFQTNEQGATTSYDGTIAGLSMINCTAGNHIVFNAENKSISCSSFGAAFHTQVYIRSNRMIIFDWVFYGLITAAVLLVMTFDNNFSRETS